MLSGDNKRSVCDKSYQTNKEKRQKGENFSICLHIVLVMEYILYLSNPINRIGVTVSVA